jgi:hypothetical protein
VTATPNSDAFAMDDNLLLELDYYIAVASLFLMRNNFKMIIRNFSNLSIWFYF